MEDFEMISVINLWVEVFIRIYRMLFNVICF